MFSKRKLTDYLASGSSQLPLIDRGELLEQPKRRRPGSFPKPRLLEKEIKQAIIECLRLHPLVVRESVRTFGVSAGRISRPDGSLTAWRQWGEPGTPDLFGKLKNGRNFRIEVKTPARRNAVTPEQRDRLDETIAAGGLAGVACSVEEALAIVEGRA